MGLVNAMILLSYSEVPPIFTLLICPAVFVVYPIFALLLNMDDQIWWPIMMITNALVYGISTHLVFRLIRRKLSN